MSGSRPAMDRSAAVLRRARSAGGAVAACLLIVLLAGCGPQAGESRLLLEDVAASTAPSQLKASTPAPQRETISWEVDGRPGVGDLYRSGSGPHARVVLIPGLSPHGKDDPRLIALAHSLARVRFAVLIPDLQSVRQLRVEPEDARVIADAARHFSTLPLPGVAPAPVGVAAISYAVGPAVLAALEPDAASAMAFVFGVGGYYDMVTVLTWMTTGYHRDDPDAAWELGQPNTAGAWQFAASNADRLSDPADREALAALARRRLGDVGHPLDDAVATLGPEGQAVVALLENRNPEAVPDLVAALPQVLRTDLHALSPAHRDLSSLDVRVYLVHGRNDPVIPAGESRRLADAIGRGARLFLVDQLDHVNLDDELGLRDRLTLLRAGMALLDERDRAATAVDP